MRRVGFPLSRSGVKGFAGWLRWMVYLACLTGLSGATLAVAQGVRSAGDAGGARAAVQRTATLSSPAVAEVFAQPVSADVTQSMHWPAALEALGRPGEAALLRQYLLHAWLQQLQRLPAGPQLTVAQAVEAGRPHFDAQLAVQGQPVWQAAVSQRLRVELPAAYVPLPDEIDNLQPDLTEEAPGFWAHRQRDGALRTLFLWVRLRNIGPDAMAINPFGLRLGDGSKGHHLSWRCEPPRTQPLLPMPVGGISQWLCRANDLPVLQQGQTLGGVLAQGAAQNEWRIEARDFAYDPSRNNLIRLLAQAREAELAAFVARNASCDRQGNCAQPSTQAASTAQSAALPAGQSATPAATPAPHAAQAPAPPGVWARLWDNAKWVGALVLAVGVYAVVAAKVSNLVAALLVLGVTGYFSVTYIHALWSMNWADNWGGLAVLPITAVLAVAPFVLATLAHSAYRLAVSPQARARASASFWQFMMLVAALLVMRLLSLLFGWD